MKRFICTLLCVCLFLSAFTGVCFAGDSEYWPAQTAYFKALEDNNDAAILKAVKQIEAAYPNPKTEAEYSRVAFPVQKAAQIYEKQGKYDEAVQYYKKFLKYVTWLDKYTKAEHSFYILSLPALIEHLSVQPEVYAATTNQKTVPYYGAKYEPKLGTYFGTCNEFTSGKESAFLLYVAFGIENIDDFDWRIPQTTSDYIMEVAWNLQKENLAGLKEVNSGKYDSYIRSNAKYLSTLKGKIILRFGAEVNSWDDNSKYPKEMIKEYKKAYIRVAKVIREVAPNIALVYSPNAVSNLNVTVKDFYPGDQYVDWVGMSLYQNLSSKAENKVSVTDAMYGRGRYENIMIKIKPIMDAFGGKKPIMISECGFAYSSPNGTQTQAHAVQMVKEFYSYVNCIYPQVKLILYFDVAKAPVTNETYGLSGNAAFLKAYTQSVKANAAMQGTLPGKTAVSYTKLDNFSQKTNQLDLMVYASYPSHRGTTVTVSVDGKKKLTATSAPYSLKVNTSKWSVGLHTITVSAKSGSTTRTVTKYLKKTASGTISAVTGLDADTKISSIKTQTYTGKAIKPAVKVTHEGKTLKKGTDYTVSYKNNVKAGKATLVITGKGNYAGTIKKTFTIAPRKIANCSVKLSTTKYTYNGKVRTPAVTVKYAGKTLKKGTDYTITYAKGRKNVGTYKVTIKMKGNFSGTKALSFKVIPAATKVSKLTAGKKSITVAIAKKTAQVTGYQVQYSTSSKFTKATIKKVASYKTTKYALKSLTAKKTYYVRVRTFKKVGKTTYYSAWSAGKAVKTK